MSTVNSRSPEKEELIEKLRAGFFDPASSIIDRELLIAFQQGLERWVQVNLFPEHPERTFICEFLPDNHQFIQIDPFASFAVESGNSELSPVGVGTILLPSTNNTVEIALIEPEGAVELIIKLQAEAASNSLAGLGPDPELDLYCDVDGPHTLDAFETMMQARWPISWATAIGSEGVWPKMGFRKLAETADGPAALSLLNLTCHVGSSRFMRLPLENIHADVHRLGDRCEYRIKVKVGSVAGQLAERLTGRLKVNHFPFWNRHLGVVDRSAYITREERSIRVEIERGVPLLVLECSDVLRGSQFVDSRWAMWVDPVRCFEFVHTGSSELRLDFKTTPSTDLRVVYLAENVCGTSGELEGSRLRRDSIQFTVLCEIPKIDNTSLSLAWWLSRGYSFPPLARFLTESELRRILWDLMPLPLKEHKPHIKFRSVLRGSSNGQCGIHGYPTIIATLEIKASPDREDLTYYCSWLQRMISPMCPIGIHVAVETSLIP
ncbi:hypothetical protein ACVMII_003892 [Bradyrhizobium diazoefficiens]